MPARRRQGFVERLHLDRRYPYRHGFPPVARLEQLSAAVVRYRVAVGPQAGSKTMTLRTPGAMVDEVPLSKPFTAPRDGFSSNAAFGCEAHERSKLERVCRYMARPPIAEERLSIVAMGWWSTYSNTPSQMAPRTCCSNPLTSSLASPSWCLDRAPISSDITACSRPCARRVQRPTPSPHRDQAIRPREHCAK